MSTSMRENDALVELDKARRPCVSVEQARDILSSIYGLEGDVVRELDSYDDRNFLIQVDGPSSNVNHTKILPNGYVLKIINPAESKTKHIDAELAAQRLLEQQGFRCPQAVPDKHGKFYSLLDLHVQQQHDHTRQGFGDDSSCLCQVRLMKYVPGQLFISVPYKPSLLIKAGAYLGRLQTALKGLSHESLQGPGTIWNLTNVPVVTKFLFAVEDDQLRHLATDVIDGFRKQVLGRLHLFSRGPVHNDYNDMNILVEPSLSPQPGVTNSHSNGSRDEDYDVTGIIDFGDLLDTYYVCEVGVAIMYMSVESKVVEPLMAGGYFLAGYLRHRTLSSEEWEVLKVCTCARYVQSLVMGAHHKRCDPTNDYTQATAIRGWDQLVKMWTTPKEELYNAWRAIISEYGPNVLD